MDYYSILNVSKNATQDEIKRAYRKLAAQHHPDRGGDTKKFQDIQAAYDTLGDQAKRQQYDIHGHGPPHGNGPGGFHFDFGSDPFGDIFANFGFRRPQAQQTYSAILFLSLEQVATGGSESMQLNFPQGSKILKVNIPKGVDDGAHVRYENILPDASLIIQYRIKQHEVFTRRGLDLYMTKAVNVFDMILGTKFTIVDIYGKQLEVNLAPKIKNGSTIRLAGRGLDNNHSIGDQYILIQAEIPDIISDELQTAIVNEQKRK
jgi:DnaJ-class molecular chaperone